MDLRARAIVFFVLVLTFVIPTVTFAQDREDRVHFFQSFEVSADENVGDAVCIVCSIHVAGTTSGDTVAILGSIVVDGTVNGDVVAVGGGVKLGEDASVRGDTVALGRGVVRHPNAVVKGEVVSQRGPAIFLGMIIGPLLPIILVVLLIVWLVRRDRRVVAAPVAYRR